MTVIAAMKRIYRTIQYFILLVKKQYPPGYYDFDFKERDKKHPMKELLSLLVGYPYYIFRAIEERLRRWRKAISSEFDSHKILNGLLAYSKGVIGYLFLAIILSLILDGIFASGVSTFLHEQKWFTDNFVNLTKSKIEIGLQIYIGSTAALLGVVFALYSLGVQISTDKYSSGVTSFITSEEPVGRYFFSFLVFTVLFCSWLFLDLELLEMTPKVSFILIATPCVFISFLGILVFKTHFVESMKPVSIFQRLGKSLREQIGIASSQDYKSNSFFIIATARESAKRYLSLIVDLYHDLKQQERYNDASYSPLAAGYLLRDYTKYKKDIDFEKSWWSSTKQERVKASDLSAFTLKANFEIRGRGPLYVSAAHATWLEDRIFNHLKEVEDDAFSNDNLKMIASVSESYKQILAGDYERRAGKMPLLIPGAVHNQEFDIFSTGLKNFFALGDRIISDQPAILDDYLNDYFQISLELYEKWPSMDEAKDLVRTFYDGDQLRNNLKKLKKQDLPTFTKGNIIDCWKTLEVEQKLEGRLITPLERTLEKIEEVLKAKREQVLNRFIDEFVNHSSSVVDTLVAKKDYNHAAHFMKLRFEWISRLFYLEDGVFAERIAAAIKKQNIYILHFPYAIIEEVEMLEQAEKGYFVAVMEEDRECFDLYIQVATFTLTILYSEFGRQKDLDTLERIARLPVIWGGAAYVLSELRQDSYYLKCVAKLLEKVIMGNGLPQFLETSADLGAIKNIGWESTRYHHWYMNLLRKLEKELPTVWESGPGEIGSSEVFDHPRRFIKDAKSWHIDIQERSIEGFVEWVKKREAIKELLELLDERLENE